MITLTNIPEYATKYEFIVVRNVEGENWFYGAYTDGFKATKIACEIGGVVIHNVRIQGKNP